MVSDTPLLQEWWMGTWSSSMQTYRRQRRSARKISSRRRQSHDCGSYSPPTGGVRPEDRHDGGGHPGRPGRARQERRTLLNSQEGGIRAPPVQDLCKTLTVIEALVWRKYGAVIGL